MQTPLVPQVPPQVVPTPLQSPLVQQLAFGMQVVVPHILNPDAHIVHSPAPVQVKFPPQGAAGGITHEPLAQVPTPTRLAPEHVALPHEPVG